MDVYGLTGGIGSGKSTVAQLLEEYGIPVVSADELSRMVVAPGTEGLEEVVRTFGAEVVDRDGELDRRKLAQTVFPDAEKRRQLETLLHPRIRDRYQQVLETLESAGHQVVVYEVPLLFEKNLQAEMKAVVLVTASEATRLRRVTARDSISEQDVRDRMAAQMKDAEKRLLADYILDNSGNLDNLRREVEMLVTRFLKVTEAQPASAVFGDEDDAEPTEPIALDADDDIEVQDLDPLEEEAEALDEEETNPKAVPPAPQKPPVDPRAKTEMRSTAPDAPDPRAKTEAPAKDGPLIPPPPIVGSKS